MVPPIVLARSPIKNIYFGKLIFFVNFLRGLYTYFSSKLKMRYLKEEVENFQKIYIKVYGVNWSPPQNPPWKRGYFQVIWDKSSFGSKNWAINTFLVSKWPSGLGLMVEQQYVPKNWFFAAGGRKILKNGEKIIFDSKKWAM